MGGENNLLLLIISIFIGWHHQARQCQKRELGVVQLTEPRLDQIWLAQTQISKLVTLLMCTIRLCTLQKQLKRTTRHGFIFGSKQCFGPQNHQGDE